MPKHSQWVSRAVRTSFGVQRVGYDAIKSESKYLHTGTNGWSWHCWSNGHFGYFREPNMVQMPTFRKWRWNLHEESPECFMSTWGCRTSVLNILYPTVSMCTYRHTIRNFETLKNLCFFPSPVVGSGTLHTHFCAFGCTYMCLLGAKTCFGPFE